MLIFTSEDKTIVLKLAVNLQVYIYYSGASTKPYSGISLIGHSVAVNSHFTSWVPTYDSIVSAPDPPCTHKKNRRKVQGGSGAETNDSNNG